MRIEGGKIGAELLKLRKIEGRLFKQLATQLLYSLVFSLNILCRREVVFPLLARAICQRRGKTPISMSYVVGQSAGNSPRRRLCRYSTPTGIITDQRESRAYIRDAISYHATASSSSLHPRCHSATGLFRMPTYCVYTPTVTLAFKTHSPAFPHSLTYCCCLYLLFPP